MNDEESGIFMRAFKQVETVHVDGWTSEQGRKALMAAEQEGFVRSHVTRTDQYTAINYTITAIGKLKLESQDPA